MANSSNGQTFRLRELDGGRPTVVHRPARSVLAGLPVLGTRTARALAPILASKGHGSILLNVSDRVKDSSVFLDLLNKFVRVAT